MTKNEVRDWVAQQKYGMGSAILEANTTLVIRRLKSQTWFKSAKKVGAFAPVADQPDVALVMSDPEKTFYIPAYDEAFGGYRLAKMGETFKRNPLCSLEPVDPEFAEADEIDLILVPGTAFDGRGNRIGPEQDVYSTLLPFYNAIKAGIAYECQYLAEIPADENDAVMDIVLTESKCLNLG
ncbi:MAG: hypothetical protein JXR25_10630 [Pontiellaceae bacterium]|nr:hypothetical protein [Pontiellaceae bacterium]MBN2785275.1 hypothetical protein [Pontiellaceae bacterium]